jgi:hypothetical protein
MDSTLSCNSSSYANELISFFNPQSGQDEPVLPSKCFRSIPITYSAAVQTPIPPPTADTSISSLTSEDLDGLFQRLQTHMGEKSTGIPTEELERKIEQSNSEVLQL